MATTPAFFSVIIPTRDRTAQLAQCLAAVAELEYPRDRLEVIVVDDGGETSPAAVVESFNHRLDLRLITQPHAGPATARNTGAAAAKGEILAFTDDDCAPAQDWLKVLAARFVTVNDCVVGGRTVNELRSNVYSTASQMLIDYLYSHYNSDPDHARFLTSNNLAITAAHFQAIGGFDGSFPRAAGEDREFCDRWTHNGGRMIYAAEVLVYHSHSMTLHSFWRQHFAYGRGAFHYHRVRARRNRERIKLEPCKFYSDLMRYPFLKLKTRRTVSIAGLLLLSQVSNAAGYYWEKKFKFQRRSMFAKRSEDVPSL
jgi:cellulose synthase/poly-beta-1,6-N-acetylglucosamine synthase-like glycosyltransferase